MQKKGPKSVKKHHHLVTGKIIFELTRENQKENEPADIHAIELNAVVTSLDGNISAQVLGRAQQQLQIHHMKRAGDQAQFIKVVDVIILAISYLGVMTDEEFSHIPPAMAQGNQVTASVSNGNVTELRPWNQKKDEQPDPFAEKH